MIFVFDFPKEINLLIALGSLLATALVTFAGKRLQSVVIWIYKWRSEKTKKSVVAKIIGNYKTLTSNFDHSSALYDYIFYLFSGLIAFIAFFISNVGLIILINMRSIGNITDSDIELVKSHAFSSIIVAVLIVISIIFFEFFLFSEMRRNLTIARDIRSIAKDKTKFKERVIRDIRRLIPDLDNKLLDIPPVPEHNDR